MAYRKSTHSKSASVETMKSIPKDLLNFVKNNKKGDSNLNFYSFDKSMRLNINIFMLIDEIALYIK